jgi:glycosyltransferase involved in cell wall biosynthesis
MRVLLVSDVYFPRVNGVSTSIASFRTGLAAAGVSTTLVCPSYEAAPGAGNGPGAGGGLEAGADCSAEPGVLRVPAGTVPFDPEDRRMRWRALQQRMGALQGQGFDLVHVQTPFQAHYAGLRFARRAGIPVVTTFHTLFEEYLHLYVPLLPRSLGRRVARALTRAQCNAVDGVVAPSRPMAELLTAIGVREPPRVIPTGLPADRFIQGNGARFRRRYGLPDRRPLLLCVGRVAREKNLGFLLHSFLEVRRARPDAMLVIAGEGPAARRYARGWDQARMAGRLQEFYAELCARAKIARGLPPAVPGEPHERQACLDSR